MQSDVSETDGENDDNKVLEMHGIKYPHKSWFFVYHSTIEGLCFTFITQFIKYLTLNCAELYNISSIVVLKFPF